MLVSSFLFFFSFLQHGMVHGVLGSRHIRIYTIGTNCTDTTQSDILGNEDTRGLRAERARFGQ